MKKYKNEAEAIAGWQLSEMQNEKQISQSAHFSIQIASQHYLLRRTEEPLQLAIDEIEAKTFEPTRTL